MDASKSWNLHVYPTFYDHSLTFLYSAVPWNIDSRLRDYAHALHIFISFVSINREICFIVDQDLNFHSRPGYDFFSPRYSVPDGLRAHFEPAAVS